MLTELSDSAAAVEGVDASASQATSGNCTAVDGSSDIAFFDAKDAGSARSSAANSLHSHLLSALGTARTTFLAPTKMDEIKEPQPSGDVDVGAPAEPSTAASPSTGAESDASTKGADENDKAAPSSGGITLGPVYSTGEQLLSSSGQWFSAVKAWTESKKDSKGQADECANTAVDDANRGDVASPDPLRNDQASNDQSDEVEKNKMWSTVSITTEPELTGTSGIDGTSTSQADSDISGTSKSDAVAGSMITGAQGDSTISAIGQSIFSGGGQLLSAVQAWRDTKPEAHQGTELDKARETDDTALNEAEVLGQSDGSMHPESAGSAGASGAGASTSEHEGVGTLDATKTDATSGAGGSRVTGISQSLLSTGGSILNTGLNTGGQLFGAVQAWRETKKEPQETRCAEMLQAAEEEKGDGLQQQQQKQDSTTFSASPTIGGQTEDAADQDVPRRSDAGEVMPGGGGEAVQRRSSNGDVLKPNPVEDNIVSPARHVTNDSAGDWCVLERELVSCWRCGVLVSPHIEAIEAHSSVCSRPSMKIKCEQESIPRPATGGEAPPTPSQLSCSRSVLATEAPASEQIIYSTSSGASTADPGNLQASSGKERQREGADQSTSSAILDQEPELVEPVRSTHGPGTGSMLQIPTAAISAVGRMKDLGRQAKDRACLYFVRDGFQLPKDGLVKIQTAHTGLFLSIGGINAADASSLGLRSEGILDESQWLLVKTSTEGVFGIKSIHSGRCLGIAGKASGRDQVCLGSSELTALQEWRIMKAPSGGALSVQSAYNGLFMAARSCGVIDGIEVEMNDNAMSSDSEWRISEEQPEAVDSEQSTPKPSLIQSLTPALDPLEVYARIEATMERSILLVLDPVLNGIPSLGIAPASAEAQRLGKEHGSAEDAIAAMQKKVDEDEASPGLSQKLLQKASEVLVMRFLPIVGAGAYLSYTLYSRLRLAALIAELCGHDTKDPEVQSMLLFCITPDGAQAGDGEHSNASDKTADDGSDKKGVKTAVIRSAQVLSHTLVRQVLKRATGWKTAADLYDLAAAVCAESYTHVHGSGEAEDAQQVEGAQQATLRRAALLFRPSRNKTVRPATLILLSLGACVPVVASLLRNALRIMAPIFGAQVGMAVLICIVSTIAVAVAMFRYQLMDFASEVAYERPELVSSVVFLAHAALPLLAAFDATAMIVDGLGRNLMSTGEQGQHGSGCLVVLLGTWSWLRLWQRCRAEPGSAAARGDSTTWQRLLLVSMILIGAFDMLGLEGLHVHAWPTFGSMRSHHWFFAVLKVQALECQMRLLTLLRDRDNLLRILGATRMMSLAFVLFLGGLTASVGFLVSRSEFQRFVDTLAPPPQAMTVILALRRRGALDGLMLGLGAGILWQMPAIAALARVMRFLGIVVGAAAVGFAAETFEEHREALLDPNGGRWLLLFPDKSERAREQARQVWTKFSAEATQVGVSAGTSMVGQSIISRSLDYAASWWAQAPAEAVANAVNAVEAVEGH